LANVFWTSYLATARPQNPLELERNTVGLLGCLLAARVDGKSPAEYLATDTLREGVRALAGGILLDEPATLGEVRELTLSSISDADSLT
jgi:hypothetical protein